MIEEKVIVDSAIMVFANAIDDGIVLPVEDVVAAVAKKDIASVFPESGNRLFTNSIVGASSANYTALNEALYRAMISEYLEGDPARAGRKWGIRNNGLCLLICLCSEALR